MTVKGLKQGQCARTAQLKVQLLELISVYEFETGQLVNCIEFQGGDRTGTLETPHEIEVLLDDDVTEPPSFVGINPDKAILGSSLKRSALDLDVEMDKINQFFNKDVEVGCG